MAKVITFKKDATIEQMKEKLQSAGENNEGIDAHKYSGVIKITEVPLDYQRKIRNEWN